MKNIGVLQGVLLLLLNSICPDSSGQISNEELIGAWQKGPEENRIVWINSEKHFSATVYNIEEKKFLGTCGGAWTIEGNVLVETHEFNTLDPEKIGMVVRNEIKMNGDRLIIKTPAGEEEWTRVDDGTPGKLAGAWVITGRAAAGGIQKMTPGARKTMKILSGTRFQWIAYNSETKQFFGSGGGTYTTQGGTYVEHIDFFSRDNSRVGKSLEFNFLLKDGDWHHSGTSTKGDPVNEIWTRREVLGL